MHRTHLDNKTLFRLMKRVTNIIFNHVLIDNSIHAYRVPYLEDRRDRLVNPFSYQTRYGFFLELQYGYTKSLWTPWGRWEFAGSSSGDWSDTLPSILHQLGAEKYIEENDKYFGPIYKIYQATDKYKLPEPIILTSQSEYAPYEVALTGWITSSDNDALLMKYYNEYEKYKNSTEEHLIQYSRMFLEFRKEMRDRKLIRIKK